jgi:phosphatidylserine decarboxylase
MPLRNEPIEVFNRYTGATEVERVYGESWLRWTYESGLGRASLHALVKRAWFSRWYGWRMSRPASAARVEPFIAQYGLDASELDRPADSFATFNEFFSRPLRAGARPIDPDVRSVVFPADGRHLGFARWGTQDRVYAKGQSFDLASLLGDAALGREFAGGALVISRLCPVDYHRFHFPIGGVAGAPRAIEGPLFSVSPIALRRRVEYLVDFFASAARVSSLSSKPAASLSRTISCGSRWPAVRSTRAWATEWGPFGKPRSESRPQLEHSTRYT